MASTGVHAKTLLGRMEWADLTLSISLWSPVPTTVTGKQKDMLLCDAATT